MRAQISSLKNSLSLSSFGKRWHDFGTGRILVALALLLIILVGGWLRIRYVQQVALHVDEFVTLWAAQRILETGLPFMPSGMFYGRGLLTSYLAAGAMAVGGLNDSVGRIPGVLFGLFGIIGIFAVGRNAWNVRVGLLAAVGLTLLPEAIDAAGRVRFYAQFMLWTLLTLWAAYQLTRRPGGGWRMPLLVVIIFYAGAVHPGRNDSALSGHCAGPAVVARHRGVPQAARCLCAGRLRRCNRWRGICWNGLERSTASTQFNQTKPTWACFCFGKRPGTHSPGCS